jgi:hypothetical protein
MPISATTSTRFIDAMAQTAAANEMLDAINASTEITSSLDATTAQSGASMIGVNVSQFTPIGSPTTVEATLEALLTGGTSATNVQLLSISSVTGPTAGVASFAVQVKNGQNSPVSVATNVCVTLLATTGATATNGAAGGAGINSGAAAAIWMGYFVTNSSGLLDLAVHDTHSGDQVVVQVTANGCQSAVLDISGF